MGEMGLWYTLSSAVFLGGGVPEGIGGHNPLEPARLGRRIVSGPHVHNFAEIFETLAQTGAVTFAKTAAEVCAFWEGQLSGQTPEIRLDAYFREGDAPMMTSLEAVCSLIEKGRSDA
jgi:3-deoxy-D-manno-octulosonic-acid transferase